MNNVGTRIKQARQQKGLSQQALANLAHVSQPTVANWENGSHAPRHKALGKLSHILDTSPSWLLGETIYSNGPEGPLPEGLLSDLASTNMPISAQNQQPSFNSHHVNLGTDSDGRLHHIAVLSWPSRKEQLWRAPVKNYISTHIEAIRPIALQICKNAAHQCEHAAKFPFGSTLIIDLGKTAPKAGALFLIEGQGSIKLHRLGSDSAATPLPILGQAIMSQHPI